MRREIILMEIKCAGMNLHRRRKGDIVDTCVRIGIARRFFPRPRGVYEPMSSNAADRNRSGRRYTYGVSLTNRRLPFNDRRCIIGEEKRLPTTSREAGF